MPKLMVIPNKKDIDRILKYTNTILVGLKNYSVNFNDSFSIDEIEELSKKNIDLFVSINKNLHSNELDDVKKQIIKLSKLNISGIFFYDISIVQIKKELNLDINLVWSQEHLTTNYGTINFWNKYGVDYTYISSDITMDEINEILENTNKKIIVPIFGYVPMFVSERHIVNNYLKHFNIKDESKKHIIKKEEKEYLIIDNELGTNAYAYGILNGYNEYLSLKSEYVTLNELNIDIDTFEKILEIFKSKDIDGEEKINNLIKNTSKHFLHTKTIYRVKNHA